MSSDIAIAGEFREPRLKPLPRLRIHHFLLWTAVTAGWLTVGRLLLDASVDQSVSYVYVAFLAIVWGAVTTVGGLGIVWRLKGMAFFTQPGQWLIAWELASIVFQTAMSLIAFWMFSEPGDEPSGPWRLVFHPLPHAIVRFIAFILLIWLAADARSWRVFFIVWAAAYLLPYLVAVLGPNWLPLMVYSNWLYIPLSVLTLVCLCIAAVRDWQRPPALPRHWTHWTGVAAWLIMNGTLLTMWAVWTFTQ